MCVTDFEENFTMCICLGYTGQFYNLTLKANTNMTLPEGVKSVIYVTFFDEPDKRMEYNHWRYWYDLQANPNQRAFDVGKKHTWSDGKSSVYMCDSTTINELDYICKILFSVLFGNFC